jgi:hypothetical protein
MCCTDKFMAVYFPWVQFQEDHGKFRIGTFLSPQKLLKYHNTLSDLSGNCLY